LRKVKKKKYASRVCAILTMKYEICRKSVVQTRMKIFIKKENIIGNWNMQQTVITLTFTLIIVKDVFYGSDLTDQTRWPLILHNVWNTR